MMVSKVFQPIDFVPSGISFDELFQTKKAFRCLRYVKRSFCGSQLTVDEQSLIVNNSKAKCLSGDRSVN